MLALGNAIGTGNGELTDDARVVERRSASDFIATARSADAHGSTWFTVKDGWQIALSTFGRETVEHCSQKLHQRRLASFIRTVENGHPFGHRVDGKAGPNTKAIYLNIAYLHALVPPNLLVGANKSIL